MGEMLIVTPVCNQDLGRLISLLNWLNEIDSCSDLTAFLVFDKGADWKAIEKYYRKYFGYYYTWELQDSSGSTQWPVPQNHMFKRVAQHLGGQFTQLHQIPEKFDKFFFMEPDVLPFEKDWAKRLNSLYEEGGKPFMGSVVDTISNGQITGKHMNGAAVYPRNAITYSQAFTFSQNNPWDIMSAKDLEGKVNDISEYYKVTFNSFAYSGAYRKYGCYQKFMDGELKLVEGSFYNHFIHHGCKDGSLLEMIRKEKQKPKELKSIVMGYKKHKPAKRYRKKEFFPEYHKKRYGTTKKQERRDTTF